MTEKTPITLALMLATALLMASSTSWATGASQPTNRRLAVMLQAQVQVRTMPSKYGCRVDPKLYLLKNPFEDTAVVSAVGSELSYRSFGVLYLRESEEQGKSKRAKTKAIAIIDGGFVDGLAIGATGAVLQRTPDGKLKKLAAATVQSLTAFESICEVVIEREKVVTKYHSVSFQIPPESEDAQIAQGLAFTEEVTDSVRGCDRIPLHKELALACLRLGNVHGLERHTDRLLQLDSLNQDAAILQQAITVIQPCDSATADADILNRIQVLPEMPYYIIPESPTDQDITATSVGNLVTDTYMAGTVWIKCLIDVKGNIETVGVEQSSGWEPLDKAAIKAAYTSRFKPAVVCGRAASCWIAWKVEFFFE